MTPYSREKQKLKILERVFKRFAWVNVFGLTVYLRTTILDTIEVPYLRITLGTL